MGLKTLSTAEMHERIAGPRIKSIVALKRPVRVVRHSTLQAKDTNMDADPVLDLAKRNYLGQSGEAPVRPEVTQASPARSSNLSKTDRQSPLHDACNLQNIRANQERPDERKAFGGAILNDEMENDDVSMVSVENAGVAVHKSESSLRNNNTGISMACIKNNIGKENKKLELEKDSIDKCFGKNNIKSKNFDTASCKQSTPAIVATSTKKTAPTSLGRLKLQSVEPTAKRTIKVSRASSKAFREGSKAKNLANNVMPCYKYNKCTENKATHVVKSTVVRDIMGHKMETCVGPGILHNGQDKEGQLEVRSVVRNKLNFSREKFLCPEYNSIICTINELAKIKQGKFVTDTEELPATYKNIVNEKVSRVLDFPLGEAIYKNLVDLTIDEKLLPSRVTRTKDPEPKQKDIIPRLSDFFIPEFIDEHCVSVSIKSRAPEIVENWSAFTISNKVFGWKDRLDNVE
ncbi:hypothetical protein KM043_012320 [Ampulex compressa]|nr:hypothetical protein KM043_012320 [Ampulex compressa]